MWQPHNGPGAERAVLEPTADGFRLAGTSLLVAGGATHEIRYTVLVDGQWRTQTVGAHVQGPGSDRRLALHADGQGAWSAGDAPVVDLFGALDIDLAWTPATITLPVRRLALVPGESAEVVVAHVAFPAHEVERRRYRYTRVADRIYRVEAPGSTVELTVDESGLVTDFPGRWRSVATG